MLCRSCLLAGIALAMSAQETVRVTTRLVQLSVVAGVSDLGKEDLDLFDGGRPEQIAYFGAERFEPGRAATPGAFSNRRPQPAAGATAILFDGLNTRLVDQTYARQQILRFLDQLQPGERVALYVLGRGPRVVQDFTDDPAALRSALANHRPEVSPSLEAPLHDLSLTGPMQLDAWLGELTFRLADHFERDRGLRTIRSLAAIAGHLRYLPGRKNLVWVAGSFPAWFGRDSVPLAKRSGGFDLELERAARTLSDANLAVYPVDARGLMAPSEYAPERAAPSGAPRGGDLASIGTMVSLAERTGGRAVYNTNDLAAAFRRAVSDGRSAYLIEYRPTHNRWDGSFREIRLRSKRAGLGLKYRRGYFAQPDESAEPWYRQAVLETAMWSPIDATGLGLGVRATGRFDLGLEIDADGITFQQKEGKWRGSLDVWIVLFGARDRHLKTLARTAAIELDHPTYERVTRARAFLLEERVADAEGAVTLRVLVRDVASGALGSVTIPASRVPLR
jgi:VWFA-related protein